jgi:NAD(P)-dependent dehydrogenase (short-subunit alcohol dehydrogenase family)
MDNNIFNNPISISGKVIYLTGGMGQIGRTIARSFLLQGAKVVIADINIDSQNSFVNEIKNIGIDRSYLLFSKVDISKKRSCELSIENVIKQFGRIDVLINNAAIDAKFDNIGVSKNNNSRFENYPIKLLKKSIEVNLLGTIIITQIVCKYMLRQGNGNIINVASTYSLVSPNQNLYDFGDGITQFKPVDYIASKSFIPNFTRYLATFYAKNNIRCNAIVPHGIFNEHSKEFLINWGKLSPIGRMCNREELIGPFTFLCSDASSYMTGSILSVDGGWTAW